MSEWISVKDQLPEHDVKVLVITNDRFISFDFLPFENYITHWQPLPEPPKPTNLIDSFIADGGFDKVMGCKNGSR